MFHRFLHEKKTVWDASTSVGTLRPRNHIPQYGGAPHFDLADPSLTVLMVLSRGYSVGGLSRSDQDDFGGWKRWFKAADAETFWDILRHSETFSDILRHSETFWDILRHSETLIYGWSWAMWVKDGKALHIVNHPRFHHFDRWYKHSQSWVVDVALFFPRFVYQCLDVGLTS